jgi:hypothetical protein
MANIPKSRWIGVGHTYWCGTYLLVWNTSAIIWPDGRLHELTRLFVLFVCLEPHEQFFKYLAAVTITGDKAANLGLCSALRTFEQGGIFIVPHLLRHGASVYTVSIGRPEPHVPQWDSNSRRKDRQIFAPDTLTTAPRRRHLDYENDRKKLRNTVGKRDFRNPL